MFFDTGQSVYGNLIWLMCMILILILSIEFFLSFRSRSDPTMRTLRRERVPHLTVKLSVTVKAKKCDIRWFCRTLRSWYRVKFAWHSSKRFVVLICWGEHYLNGFDKFSRYFLVNFLEQTGSRMFVMWTVLVLSRTLTSTTMIRVRY